MAISRNSPFYRPELKLYKVWLRRKSGVFSRLTMAGSKTCAIANIQVDLDCERSIDPGKAYRAELATG